MACIKLVAKNNGDSSKYVSFVFTWKNRIGAGGCPQCKIFDYRGNTVECRHEGLHQYLYFSHTKPKADRRLNGNVSLSIFNDKGLDTSYMLMDNIGFDTVDINDPALFGSRESLSMWPYFNRYGRLTDTTIHEKQSIGALAAGKVLARGEVLEVPYLLSWHFPERDAHEYEHITYRNMYAKWFNSSVDAARYFYKNMQTLYDKTKDWQNPYAPSASPHQGMSDQ